MDTLKFTLLLLIGTLWTASVMGSCKFGRFCHYPCHCLDNAVCNPLDGSCPSGCDDGNLMESEDYWYTGAWSGYGCQLGNVAYNKSTKQHTNAYPEWPAALAVDGNHNPNIYQGHCAHPGHRTEPGPAWWGVVLGSNYIVSSINITNRGDCCGEHTAFLNIFVSDAEGDESITNLCHSIGSEGSAPNTYIHCTRIMLGRYVRLKRQTDAPFGGTMNICEVQVFGYLHQDCPDDHFGVACGTPCNCQGHCDDLDGECNAICRVGWMGTNCQIPCDDGDWGAGCVERCHCRDDDTCDRFNGQCPSGCSSEYGGSSCNLVLPVLNSVVGLSSASPTTLDISFVPWNLARDNGHTPAGYEVQWRVNGSTVWITGMEIHHSIDIDTHTAMLRNLEPDTAYYIRVVPFIVEGDMRYYSFVSQEGGPFQTHQEDNDASGVPVAIVAGSIVGLIILLVLVLIIVFLVRRRVKRRGNDISRTPMVNESIEHGHEAPVYENATAECENTLNKNKDIGETSNGNVEMVDDDLYEPTGDVNYTLGEEKTVADEHADNLVQDTDSNSSISEDHVYGNQELLGRPVKAAELSSYIDGMLHREGGFAGEYVQIPDAVSAVCLESLKTENKKLHRFNNICAYDHSRVVLNVSPDEDRTDYINANYIHKYKDDPTGYIAAQGPKKATVVDMWTMIWQTEANRIVMVTNLCEAGKIKCEQYWPNQGVMVIGKYKVSFVSTEEFADYTIRILSVTDGQSASRAVYHFHFTGWPDNDVPKDATSLLDFHRKVRSRDNITKGPIIVHCSAGVGRTGTFLALDYLLDQVKAEGIVDVFTYTAVMRSNRMQMIQTLEQYVFVYKALLEALQAGETSVPSSELEMRYKELKQSTGKSGRSILEEQFATLQCLQLSRKSNSNETALDEKNIAKNRDRNIVPSNKYRIYLSSLVEGTTDYINAVAVDGYRMRHAYIATQLPMSNTIVDLWRLVYDHKCSCIIALEQPVPGDENTPLYWPTETENPIVMGQLRVTLMKEESLDEGTINMMEFEISLADQGCHSMRLYQFLAWPDNAETPLSMETTLMLLDHAQRWQLRSGLGPLCFICKFGYERCGLMIAACYMLEKLKVDREVDVFQAVKQVRTPRPEFVMSQAQYEHLYELAMAYINSCEDYANFRDIL